MFRYTLFAVEAGTTKLENSAAILDFARDFTLLRGFNLSYKMPDIKKARRLGQKFAQEEKTGSV
jgi:hypothetical protein